SSAVFSGFACAQTGPLYQIVGNHNNINAFTTQTYNYQCPAGAIPVSYSFVTRNPNNDAYIETDRSLVSSTGAKINRNTLSSLDQLVGGGLSSTLYNINCHGSTFEAFVGCIAPAVSTDNKLVMVKATATAGKEAIATATAFCPADSPVALGGF